MFKTILTFFLLVFVNNLKVMIYITLFIVSIPMLFNTRIIIMKFLKIAKKNKIQYINQNEIIEKV